MGDSNGWWQATAGDYPNRLLIGPAEVRPVRWFVPALLLLASFLPRAWDATHRSQVWTDSVTFYEASLALERGDYNTAFHGLGLNLYPVILWGLRAAGLDWEVAATWWSVALGTLAVLPLFGWVRRQFDDTVAITACLLYAVQGKLVAVSTLAIRDATFWFTFLLTVYWAWRAIVEIRWRYFLLAGVALTLSVHLRTEGWLLMVLIVLWAAFRAPAVRPQWKKLAAGTVCCLAIVPLSVTAVNLTLLRSAPQWGFLRKEHVAMARQSLLHEHAPPDSNSTSTPAARTEARQTPAVDFDQINLPPSFSTMKNLRTLGLLFVKSYTYACGLLALLGVLAWRKVYYRRDQQTPLAMALLLMLMIWIRSSEGRCDIRYFFPMVLVSFPWIALGFLAVPMYLMRWTGRFFEWTRPRQTACVAALAAIVLVPNYFEAKTTWAGFMDSQAAIGRWLLAEYGPGRSIRANIEERRLVQYYAQTPAVERFSVKEFDAGGPPPTWLAADAPQVILVWFDLEKDRKPFDAFADAVLARGELGYRRVPPAELPPACNDVHVLSRLGAVGRGGAPDRPALR